MTERAIKTPEERYRDEWAFNRIVNAIVWGIRYHGLTRSSVLDAFNLAMQKQAEQSTSFATAASAASSLPNTGRDQ